MARSRKRIRKIVPRNVPKGALDNSGKNHENTNVGVRVKGSGMTITAGTSGFMQGRMTARAIPTSRSDAFMSSGGSLKTPYNAEFSEVFDDLHDEAATGHPFGCNCPSCGQMMMLKRLHKSGLIKDVRIGPAGQPHVTVPANVPMDTVKQIRDIMTSQPGMVTGAHQIKIDYPNETDETKEPQRHSRQFRAADAIVERKFIQPKDRPELFYLPNETVLATTQEEIEATYADMEEFGIAKLPYPIIEIGCQGDLLLRLEPHNNGELSFAIITDNTVKGAKRTNRPLAEAIETEGTPFKDWEVRFCYRDEQPYMYLVRNPRKAYLDLTKLGIGDAAHIAALVMRKILIVLLGTKNAIKTRTRDKLLSIGIGSKKNTNNYKPLYTTTISLPPALKDAATASKSTGTPKSPHLRRGHKRDQRFGPKLSQVKVIWIEPCFINADEDFVSARSAYNTSLNIKPGDISNIGNIGDL